ncbi:MAG: O-antigen ligase family protein [Parvularculaceae bacterium]
MKAPSALRLDRLIDATFLLTMPALAWFAVFGHRGAAVVAALAALAIALRPSIWREGLPLLRPSHIARAPLPRAALAGLAFVLWIALTAFWSPVPGAPKLALTVAVYGLAGGALVFEASRASPARARRTAALYAGAVTVAAAALLVEGVTGGALRAIVPPTDLSPLRFKDMTALARGVTLIAPLAFPAAAILYAMFGARAVAAAPIALTFAAAMQFSVAANVAAMTFAALAGAAALWRPRAVLIALGALFLFSLLAAPLLVLAPADLVAGADGALLPASWAQRVIVWKAAAERIFGACAGLGCGADYTRALMAEGVMIDVPASPIPLQEAPTHPHNLFVQVWLELGLPGVIALALTLWFAMQRLVAVPLRRLPFAAIAAAAAATYISFMFEASLWQAWRLAILSLAAFGAALSYSFNRSGQNYRSRSS